VLGKISPGLVMLEEAIKNVCWERICGHAAIKTKCDFEQYREISEVTSVPARQVLIWTLYGSPLDVPASGGALTPQDKFFRDQRSTTKIRVVIFNTPFQARRYAAIKRHVEYGTRVRWRYRKFKRISQLVERQNSFEAACKESGKLYFTHVGLIANEIGHYFSKFSVAFVSDKGDDVYCVSSSFAASRHGDVDDIKDVVFFSLSNCDYPGADGRKHYSRLFHHLFTGKGSWYFEDPSDVAGRSSWFRHVIIQPQRLKEWVSHIIAELKSEHPWYVRSVKYLGFFSFFAYLILQCTRLYTSVSGGLRH